MNMKLPKFAVALVAIAGLASGAAQAAVIWTGDFNTGSAFDGVISNISGFDLHSDGSAAYFCASAGGCGGGSVAFGAQLDPTATTVLAGGDVISTVYQGIVSAFLPGGSAPNLNSPDNTAGTYQLTVAAQFNEVVVAGFIVSGVANATLLPLNGGVVGLFYDTNTATFANINAGTGYTDGTLIALGSVSQSASLPTSVSANGSSATGNANIAGPLSFAQLGSTTPDVVGFMPTVPSGYTSTTTLQVGGIPTGDYQTSNFFDTNAYGFTATAVNASLTEAADANTHLSVPEPETLALVGLGLVGLGLSKRRRAA